MKEISIIVTCYNLESEIEKCIESLINQTYSNFEVIIIDDGSTDNSQIVIQKAIKKDQRFQYVFKKNGGVSSARNLGLKKAKGKYICFLDGDDYVEENYIEELYKGVKNGYDFSICNIKRVYKNKITINHMDDNAVIQCKYPALWNKMCRKELFFKYHIQFLENVWYEDLAVGAELFLVSKKYNIINKNLHNYIQHENSLVKVYDDRIFDIYKIIEEVENFAKKNKIKNKKETIEFLNIYHILIGTIYRASFHKKFSPKMIKEIYKVVDKKYPKWYHNIYIKTCSFPYRVFLKALKWHCYTFIYILLKLFKKYLYL